MVRLFGWMVATGVVLGSAVVARAQTPPPVAADAPVPALANAAVPGNPGAGYGYSGINAFADGYVPNLGERAYPGVLPPGMAYGPVGGWFPGCMTLYPLSTVYPYSYTGPGRGFGNYSYVPYPYAPVGYGWYGELWRGW